MRTRVQVCEDIAASCDSVANGSSSEVIGIGACDASTAAAIKARLDFRMALHRCLCSTSCLAAIN